MAECEGINMGFEYMVCGLQWHTFAESSEAAEVQRVRPKRYSIYTAAYQMEISGFIYREWDKLYRHRQRGIQR